MNNLPALALAQVEAVFPDEYAVSVVFKNMAMLTGIRVHVSALHASAETGQFGMPKKGDWGMVVFPQDDPRSGKWLMTLADQIRNAAPLELLSQDPDLQCAFERCGRDRYQHGNGDIEVQYPDGSLFRLTHGSDYSKKTERQVSYPDGPQRQPKRRKPNKKSASKLHLYFEHAAGTKAHLDDQGTLTVKKSGSYELEASKDGHILLKNGAGAMLEIDAGGTIKVQSVGQVLIGPPGGMKPVARLGDKVVASGIDTAGHAVTVNGTIVSGSGNVFSS